VTPEAVIALDGSRALICDEVLCDSYLMALPVLFLSSLTPVNITQHIPPDTTAVITVVLISH